MTANSVPTLIWSYLINAGLTPFGAAGLMGNLNAESGLLPERVEILCLQRLKENGQIYTDETYTEAVDCGRISRKAFLNPLPGRQYGYGLCQWTSPERKAGLYDLCKQRSVSIADLETQLDYLMSELNISYKKVLGILKTAKTVQEASDWVLCNFEQPDDCSYAVRAYRTSLGQKIYDEYNNKEGVMSMVRVSNCGHDENNRYSGGKAGDQSGTEWYLIPWYQYSNGGWNYVLRWKDNELANLFADLAIEAAQNDLVGYDQWQRNTFWTQLQAAGYRPAKIKVACETDCSKGTIDLIRAVGYLKGIADLQKCSATYTGDMMNWFQSAAGKKYFDILTGKHLTDPGVAKRGDINLNTAHHVNITVDNGENAGAETNQKEGVYMFEVGMVQVGSIGNDVKLLQQLLCYHGYGLAVDSEFGNITKSAVMEYQKKNGLVVDGIVGEQTWKNLLLR